MLDNLLNTVKRSAEKVQRRGEEVAQSARLRLEVYQLSRELDGLYNRLGRAYHAEADPAVLESVRDEVRRLDEEIAARERLIAELGEVPDDAPAQDPHHHIHAAAARTRTDQTPPAQISSTQTSSTASAHPPGVELTKPAGAASTPAAEPNLGDLPDVGRDAAHPVPPSDAPAVTSAGNAPPFVERPASGHLAAGQPAPSTPSPSTSAHRRLTHLADQTGRTHD